MAAVAVLDSGGNGGNANANSTATASGSGGATSSASATGGDGGSGADVYGPAHGGDGGGATATADASGGSATSAMATATGGAGSYVNSSGSEDRGGNGGDAVATADAVALRGGAANATATATGGQAGGVGVLGTPGAEGAANATSSATTTRGALAQAQSTAVGSSAEAQSTAQTSFYATVVQSVATAPTEGTAATNAIAQAGGAGQTFANPGQTAYAFTVGDPDKAYTATLIGGEGNIADALLGPIFGAAILGANYASGGDESDTYTATSTIDFVYGGDLTLGLIGDQQSGFTGGAGFESIEFTVLAGGTTILDQTFTSLAAADSFFDDQVINLGSSYGPGVDLTFTYTLTADGPGGYGLDFVVGGAVPEPSTWAMTLVGFAGLGFAGYRSARKAKCKGSRLSPSRS